MISHLLTAKAKGKLKYMHFRTYRRIKTAAHRLRSFLFDPNDIAPGDDFPAGPLLFLTAKVK